MTDSIFISRSGNITIRDFRAKFGWAIPSKLKDGTTLLRSGGLPMEMKLSTVSPSGELTDLEREYTLILHSEIKLTPDEARLFKEKFLDQEEVTLRTIQQ